MNLIKQNFKEVKNGGLRIFFRKLKTFIIEIISLPIYFLALFILIIIYLLQPYYLIRFGNLSSSRLGHLAADTELYFCEKEAKINIPKQKYLDLFFCRKASNNYLAKMWKRELIVLPSFLLKPIFSLNKFISSFLSIAEKHIISTTWLDRDVHNLIDTQKPHLRFTNDEINKGENFLKKFGLSKTSKFVCLIVRDNAYLKHLEPGKNWDYHNHRNSDVNNFMDAAEALAAKGFHVFRMGSKVEKKFESKNNRIVDYANLKERSDFLDIFLGAHCNFCITTSCGFDAIPFIFLVFIAYITVPIQYFFASSKKFLIITKHHYSKKTNRKLEFKELIDMQRGDSNAKSFDDNGIVLVENSPNEIKEFALEMLERCENRWEDTQEDKKIQLKFWDIYRFFIKKNNVEYLHGKINANISTNFLKNNPEWLK